MAGSSSFIALIVEGHDGVRGAAKEPERVLNFMVDDAAAEQQRMMAHGVRFVREAPDDPGVGVVGTFLDRTEPTASSCR